MNFQMEVCLFFCFTMFYTICLSIKTCYSVNNDFHPKVADSLAF